MNKPYQEGIMVPILDTYDKDDKYQEICSICLDNDIYTCKSWVKMNHCSHQFHRHCIDLWLEKNRVCPLCMKDVYEDDRDRSHNPHSLAQCMGVCFCCLIFFVLLILAIVFYVVPEIERAYPK